MHIEYIWDAISYILRIGMDAINGWCSRDFCFFNKIFPVIENT